MGTLKPQSNGVERTIIQQYVIGTLADEWAVTFGTAIWVGCGPSLSPPGCTK